MNSITIIDNFIKRTKHLQAPLERYVFPLILLLWPLAAVNQGVSLMDPTYSLGNYEYLTAGDGYWYFATFLANIVGGIFLSLPLGHTMLGMNILCGLLISLTALAAYYVLSRMIPGWMVFIGEFLAIAFCWCPTVILYNTLTYLFLTLLCLCLFLGISGVEERRTNKWFLLAGICLGLNVTVRIANAAEAALIASVWFHSAVTHDTLQRAIDKTVRCILGAVIGFGAIVLLTMVVYGPTAYFSMIPELLGATGTTSDYTAGGMIGAIVQAYGHSLRWFVILIPCTVMGYFLFSMPMFARFGWLRRLFYVAGILIVIRFYYGRGMFTTNYQDYPAMFEWGMMLLILMWITDIMGIIGVLPPQSARGKRRQSLALRRIRGGHRESGQNEHRNENGDDPGNNHGNENCEPRARISHANSIADEQFLAALSLLLILILPLGSNNYTYPVLGCMFITAPFLIWMLRRYWQETRGGRHFAWHAMAVMILVMATLQGGLFHVSFAFRDGTDGTPRTAQIDGNPITAGMYTTPDNAEALTGLLTFLQDKGLMTDHEMITFGNIPGLHYLADIAPAIDTTWPDLDSYTTERFETALIGLKQTGSTPAIVIHDTETTVHTTADKEELLAQFLTDMDYNMVYDACGYQVYVAER